MSKELLIPTESKLSDPMFCYRVCLVDLIDGIKEIPKGSPIGDTNYGKLDGPQLFFLPTGLYVGMREYADGIVHGNAVNVGPNGAIVSEGRFDHGDCVYVKTYKDSIIYSWEKNPESKLSYKLEDLAIKFSIQFNVDKDGYGEGEARISDNGKQRDVKLVRGYVERSFTTTSCSMWYWLVVASIIVIGILFGGISWKKFWFCVCSTYRHKFVHVLHKPPYLQK